MLKTNDEAQIYLKMLVLIESTSLVAEVAVEVASLASWEPMPGGDLLGAASPAWTLRRVLDRETRWIMKESEKKSFTS
jgi:hypothetical protein